jgi:hypothetical protein
LFVWVFFLFCCVCGGGVFFGGSLRVVVSC